ncbi:O-acetyltransferase OatA [Burkholderia sp. AD24]|nr:O-acetyltransferase OatA [Burkholderia sp. AD24]
MKDNIPELESLRGIAALIVVCTHFMILSPWMFDPIPIRSLDWFALLMRYSPLRILIGGYGSVVLFFVLSGFVLSIKFWNNSSDSYLIFATRRMMRIYPPYYAAVGLAIILNSAFPYHPIGALSHWFNELSRHVEPTPALLSGHALLVGTFDLSAYDSVIWSLVHEMRISLIFPLLMFVLARGSLALGLLFTLTLVAIADMTRPWLGEYSASILFSSHFAMGALLAKHFRTFTELIEKLSNKNITALLVIAILGCFYVKSPAPYGFTIFSITSLLSAASACLLVVIAVAVPTVSRLLLTNTARFFGRISYSLYLFHCVILLLAVNVFYGKLPLPLILAGTFGVSTAVATLSYRWIEKPAIRLGRRLTQAGKSRVAGVVSP